MKDYIKEVAAEFEQVCVELRSPTGGWQSLKQAENIAEGKMDQSAQTPDFEANFDSYIEAYKARIKYEELQSRYNSYLRMFQGYGEQD